MPAPDPKPGSRTIPGGAIGDRRQAGWRQLLRCASPLRVTTLADRAEFATAPTRTGCARLIGAPTTHHTNLIKDREPNRHRPLDKRSPIQGWAKARSAVPTRLTTARTSPGCRGRVG